MKAIGGDVDLGVIGKEENESDEDDDDDEDLDIDPADQDWLKWAPFLFFCWFSFSDIVDVYSIQFKYSPQLLYCSFIL